MAAEVSSAVFLGIFVKNNNLVFHSQVEFNAAELLREIRLSVSQWPNSSRVVTSLVAGQWEFGSESSSARTSSLRSR